MRIAAGICRIEETRYHYPVERRAPRYTVWLPVRVAELAEGMAVSHNASSRGMLLVTADKVDVGSPVTISVGLPPDGSEQREVLGRVVRVEENTDDPDGIWPHRLAIEFDDVVAELDAVFRALAAQGLAKIQR